MTDELFLTDGLDQPMKAENDWVLNKIEEVIKRSVEEKNAFVALNACRELVQVAKVSGLGLAKGLFLIKANWEVYEINDEFDNVVYDYVGLAKHTVDRYVKIWEMFENKEIPEIVRETIQQRNIKDLVPIANALAQGYEIKEEEWREIAEAPDYNTVSHIIRAIKGKPPRKGSLQIYLDKLGSIRDRDWETVL